ncbi:unnamed protein product [Lactuca saligna]|uniref:Secreted protein n=1 Tax=Lactuca saligna TaxID=75948 RepID=A0AA35V2B7_LACSI|nr:unnamed protein product [Lactuca saligna]
MAALAVFPLILFVQQQHTYMLLEHSIVGLCTQSAKLWRHMVVGDDSHHLMVVVVAEHRRNATEWQPTAVTAQIARRDEGGERWPYREHSVRTQLVSAGHSSDFVLCGVSSAVRDFTGAAEEVTMAFNDKVAEARTIAPGGLAPSETGRKCAVGGLTSGRRESRRWWRL